MTEMNETIPAGRRAIRVDQFGQSREQSLPGSQAGQLLGGREFETSPSLPIRPQLKCFGKEFSSQGEFFPRRQYDIQLANMIAG